MLMDLKKDWEFNVLQVYNYKASGKLDGYFNFIKQNHNKLDGDICEVGVYRGFSILATGLLLRELGSEKKVYGFDSFSGFPSYHENDQLSKFDDLYLSRDISKKHFEEYKKNIRYKEFLSKKNLDASSISTSLDFSDTSLNLLQNKIDYLSLDNVVLIDGDYRNTMKNNSLKDVDFMSALIDCDLYESHKLSLPFVWDRMLLNGQMYLDEYYSLKFPGARIATNEFFAGKHDKPQMYPQNTRDFERWYVIKKNN